MNVNAHFKQHICGHKFTGLKFSSWEIFLVSKIKYTLYKNDFFEIRFVQMKINLREHKIFNKDDKILGKIYA